MNNKVKELLNALYTQEELEQRRITRAEKMSRKNRRRILGGISSCEDLKVAPVNDYTHFIDCEVSPTICPMQWEDLEINFNSQDKRFCEYCEKDVYKADNEFMLEKLLQEEKCMAIPYGLLKKLDEKMDDERYENLQNRLLVSKLFLVYKTQQCGFERFRGNQLTQDEILKEIIQDLFNTKDIKSEIEWYEDKGVDIHSILSIVLPNISDVKFKEEISKKMDVIIKNN